MNNVAFVGRWAKEIELQYTKNGTAVAKSILAINRRVKVDGQPDADFAPIIMWGPIAESVAQYTDKGSLVAVTARFQSRSYENSEGRKVYVNEFVAEDVRFLDKKKENDNGNNNNVNYDDPFATSTPIDFSDDDLPF